MTDEIRYVAGIDFAEAELRALVAEDPRSFCRAPRQQCTNMTDCYSSKACQHAPSDEEMEAGEMSQCLGGPGFASASRGPAWPDATLPSAYRCKPDSHLGPVTVSGATLCCSVCGTLWNVERLSTDATPKDPRYDSSRYRK